MWELQKAYTLLWKLEIFYPYFTYCLHMVRAKITHTHTHTDCTKCTLLHTNTVYWTSSSLCPHFLGVTRHCPELCRELPPHPTDEIRRENCGNKNPPRTLTHTRTHHVGLLKQWYVRSLIAIKRRTTDKDIKAIFTVSSLVRSYSNTKSFIQPDYPIQLFVTDVLQ